MKIAPTQREQAIAHLLNTLSPETLSAIHDLASGEDWPDQFHFTLGLDTRNALRKEFYWDDLALDAEWAGLLEAAATRFVESSPDEQA